MDIFGFPGFLPKTWGDVAICGVPGLARHWEVDLGAGQEVCKFSFVVATGVQFYFWAILAIGLAGFFEGQERRTRRPIYCVVEQYV